ncbi:MAG: ABC transporter permease subunit [SAR324 cluster bacterium]|nr:ABC transporter permease subunit [SAR324 cluster bacterium]MCZ6841466.1 ABC transporter permease subunit [SAR324 cluster bacterium]
MSEKRKWTLRMVGIGSFLALWEVMGRLMGDALFAPISSMVAVYPSLIEENNMLVELAKSLQHLIYGYALGCVVGITMGIAMGRSKIFEGLLQPWVSMLFATSIASLVPLFMILFGFGLAFRVAIVFMSAVWYVLLNTFHGAKGINPELIQTGRAFDARPAQIFFLILLPGLYPYILVGMRNGLAHSIRAMVIAEMYVIVGFGSVVFNTGLEVSTAPLLGALVTIMFVGIAGLESLRWIGRKTAPWYEAEKGHP